MSEFESKVEPLGTITVSGIGELALRHGVDDTLAGAIVEGNDQEYMQTWGPNDVPKERFMDVYNLKKWYYGVVSPLVLSVVDADDNLAGIAYVTHARQLQLAGNKAYVQVYDGYRERGLGGRLGTILHQAIDSSPISRTGVSISTRNQAAFQLSASLGYVINNDNGDHGSMWMDRIMPGPNLSTEPWTRLIPKQEITRRKRRTTRVVAFITP